MLLICVLIGLASLALAVRRVAGASERYTLLAAGMPALLVVLDAWIGITALEFGSLGTGLWLAVHLYVLGMIVWIARLHRERMNLISCHENELRAARNDSQAMRKLKAAFLANMNHEIRTPLTSIIGFSSLLSGEVAAEHCNMMRVIERSGQRLLDTLDSFLDLAMLEAGRVQLLNERADLAEEARFHAARFGALARSKGLALEVHTPPGPVPAHIDRSCLSRIFSRLIANAIKFTEEGSITIDVRSVNTRCRITISDTGIGIEDEYLPYLFDEFTQASTGTGRAFEGSGLGLAVTKRLVDLLDGTIDVETTPFEGSSFAITLPAALPDTGSGDGAASHPPPLAEVHQR